MASVLDMGFFSNFSIIFTFLLVWVIVYALLSMSKQMGDKKNLNALVGIAVAVLVVSTPQVVALVNYMIPWFLVLALVLFFILFGIKMFSGDADLSGAVLGGEKRVYTWIIVIVVVIMIFGFGKAFGSNTLEKGSWDGTSQVEEYVENPDVNDSGETDPTGLKNEGVGGNTVASDDFQTNMIHTMFNPKVLGLMLIMLVGVFAMFFLAD